MKRILKIAAAVLALVVVALLALPFLIDADHFRPLLEQRLSAALGRQVTIGQLSLSILKGGLSASDLSISEDPAYGTTPFLTAKSLDIGVDMRALIFDRALRVQAVTVDGADASLIQNAQGDWNFSTLGATQATPAPAPATPAPEPAEEPMDLSVRLVRLTGAHIALSDPSSKHDFNDVNFELRDFSTTAAIPFLLSASAGGGTARIEGTAGPLVEGRTAETPFDAKVEIKGLDLAATGFADASTGMGGVLTFTGDVNSNGKTAAMKGAATIDRLKVSKTGAVATLPVATNIAIAHDLKARRGNIAKSTVKLGSASATIDGSYDLSTASPTIRATLAGPNMPLQELLTFLPVFDVVLPTGASIEGGTLSLNVAAQGPIAALNTTGSVKLEKTKLANYDLGSKLKVIQQLAGLPTANSTDIDLVAANFQQSNAGTSVQGIQFVAPSIGQLTGDGTVSPNHELNFTMKAVVKTGGLLAAAIQQRGETTTVPFFITGTSANPVFRADVKSLANEKLQQVIKNPEGAVKNAKEIVNSAKGILEMFKKAPAKQPEQK